MTRQFERPNRRGVSLVIVALFLVVLMGIAALAVDLGMLQKARAEAQRAADAAALAGASAFLLDDTRAAESTLAVHRARVLADSNSMMGTKIDSTSEVTVWVISDSVKVRVKVRRANVPTWFARVFGLNTFPVGAVAAAKADYATGARCVKPIALPDLWDDTSDLPANGGDGDHLPDAGETWQYKEPPDTYQRAGYNGVDGSGTGFGSKLRDAATRDWGLRVVLRPSVSPGAAPLPCPGSLQGNKCYIPGWWGLWGDPGLADDMLKACTPLSKKPALDTTTYTMGTGYEGKGGWTAASKTIEELIKLDPNAEWDGKATDPLTGKLGTVTKSSLGSNWRASPRVWIMGLFHPDSIPKSSEQIHFNNFMLFFVEGCMDESGTKGFNSPPNCKTNDILVGRFLGLALGTATGPSPGTMTRILRLVE